jgi:hypothetical protein
LVADRKGDFRRNAPKQPAWGERREPLDREKKRKDSEGRRKAYSAVASDEPEKAATIAGEMTIITKTAPIKRSCMEVILLGEGLTSPVHMMMMP